MSISVAGVGVTTTQRSIMAEINNDKEDFGAGNRVSRYADRRCSCYMGVERIPRFGALRE